MYLREFFCFDYSAKVLVNTIMKKNNLLFVAQRPSDYIEMRRSAVALRNIGYNIYFLYHNINNIESHGEQEVIENATQLESPGVIEKFLLFTARSEKKNGIIITSKTSIRIFFSKIYHSMNLTKVRRFFLYYPFQILNFLRIIFCYISAHKKYNAILSSIQPDVIILPEDVVGLVTPQVIKAGHAKGIPSLILPYTIANQQEAFRSLCTQTNYQLEHPANRIASFFFPQWTMKQDGYALVRLPAPHIVGHELTGSTPPDPWMMNSGFANAIAVENRAMKNYYLEAGIPATKLNVVGAVYDDHLAGFFLNKKRELALLRSELGIANAKPLLVIGGCPNQTGCCNPGGFEFADMEDMARLLARAVCILQDDYEIIVRPHPNYPEMGENLATEGIRATMLDTARLVALSDLYIAFASATIRWAIACGVPTINYDVFHYDYADFKSVPGVVHVSNLPEFSSTVADLVPDSPRYAELKRLQDQAAPDWGKLDGKSATRIAHLIEELCAQKPAPRRTH